MIKRLSDAVKDRKPEYWQDRIVSQVEYACKLSNLKGGAYDELIASAEQFVIDSFEKYGVISRKTVVDAEEMLKSMSKEAKDLKILCAAHAHIDMNWMWKWDETVAITLDTFQTMLDLMEEYADFKFSQSQASVYKIVEEYNPGMLEEIKKRVKEGRWEVTASTWVEGDKNIPNGESLARHLLYTKKYLSELLDLEPGSLKLDFEPDTFGHSCNVPEVLSRGGVKYYYHCRGNESNCLYKWKAPSGASLIVYRDPNWYGFSITPSIALCAPDFYKKYQIDTMLIVYGVGDHGGGPTRRDIERIIDMNRWPVFPEIRFGTYGEFFANIEKYEDRLQVVNRELNFIFDGCYTTQTRIKMGNRYSEKLLNESEIFNSMAHLYTGSVYPGKYFSEAWINVLFNNFHDILPGSGIVDTREYAMGLMQKAMAAANSQKKNALKKIADNIDTSGLVPPDEDIRESISEGAGVGYGSEGFNISQSCRGAGKTRIFHFFNPSMHEREELVETIVWDWNGDIDRIVFKDNDNAKIRHQVICKGFNEYWGHNFLNVLIQVKVPACGYSTYVMSQDEPYEKASPFDPIPYGQINQKPYEFVLENNLIKVIFYTRDASIVSMVDRKTGEELVDSRRKAGIFRLIEEDDDAQGMTAWIVGKYMSIENLHKDVKIKMSSGSMRSSISYTIEFRNSKLEVKIWLDDNSILLNYDVTCNWCEIGKPHKSVPQLGFYLPVNFSSPSYKYDVPFGVVERTGMDIDVPANSWVASRRLENGKKDIILITDSKHGFRSLDDSMSITLIRSSYDPDPYPELGVHRFKFAVGAVESSSTNNKLIGLAYDYNHTISVLSGKPQNGVLGLSGGLVSVDGGSIAVSAVKMLEEKSDNRILVRVYETDGNNTEGVLKFSKKPGKAYFVDINETVLTDPGSFIRIENGTVRFKVLPYSLASLVVEMQTN